MISNKHKCIHVHVPKCAGTSITHTLFNRRDAHLTALQYKNLLGDTYDKYFSFAFIRNPWDRMVSYHNMLMRAKIKPHHRIVKLCTKMFGNTLFPSWINFVQWVNNESEHDLVLKKIGLNNYLEIRPQYFWLMDNSGNIIVDFIGRFERLLADFNKVCEKLEMPDKKNALRRMNSGDHGHYSSYYDSETRDMVGEIFELDCEHFGYDFN